MHKGVPRAVEAVYGVTEALAGLQLTLVEFVVADAPAQGATRACVAANDPGSQILGGDRWLRRQDPAPTVWRRS